MKRHPSLQPLSRDHHEGLMQARTLLESAEKDAGARKRALAALEIAWREVLKNHFEEEERLLLPILGECADSERLSREHAELRTWLQTVLAEDRSPDPDPEKIRAFARMLHDHIRWEERALFPRLERDAAASDLDAVGKELAKMEASRPRAQDRGFCA